MLQPCQVIRIPVWCSDFSGFLWLWLNSHATFRIGCSRKFHFLVSLKCVDHGSGASTQTIDLRANHILDISCKLAFQMLVINWQHLWPKHVFQAPLLILVIFLSNLLPQPFWMRNPWNWIDHLQFVIEKDMADQVFFRNLESWVALFWRLVAKEWI